MNTRYLLLVFVLVASPGCESMSMNEGKFNAVMAAGQAGKFRRETGRWPRNQGELIAHGCPALDESRAERAEVGKARPAATGCRFFADLPYRLDLQPRAGDLRMVLRDAADKLVCRLVIIAPPVESTRSLLPQVRIKTTVFTCPGEGKSW